jgi:hypothetical protein
MTTPAKDKALQYVGDIMDAYKAAEKAGATALGHALECGKHLRSAKNTVEAAKGKWNSWRTANLPDVSEETERVYRRLYDAVALKEDFFAECTSIRAALVHLSKFDPETLEPKPAPALRKPRSKQTGSSATAPPDATPSTDPAVVLQATAADEIIVNIQGDTDKLEDVARGSIIALTPQAVCDALTEAWPTDQIVDLQNRLVAYLNALSGETKPPTTYPGPGLEQRPQT